MSENGDKEGLATASRIAVLALVAVVGIPLGANQWSEMSRNRQRAAARGLHLKEAGRHVVQGRYDLASIGYRKAAAVGVGDLVAIRAADHLVVLNSVRNPHTLKGQITKEVEYVSELALGRSARPQHAEYYLSARGAVRAVQGRIDIALADFDAAIAVNPDFAPAHYFKGKVLADRGRPKDGRPSLEKALALDSRLTVAHKRLARLLIDGGDLDAAAAQVQTLISGGGDAEAHYLMGIVKDKQQDHEAAREQFMAAYRADPKFPNLMRALGITMFKLKRWKDAVQILSTVYEKTRAMDIYYFIGRSLMELKEFQQAANIFQAVISSMPGHAQARFDLATLLDNGNQNAAAVAHYRAFLQIVKRSGRKDLSVEARTAQARVDALQAAGGK